MGSSGALPNTTGNLNVGGTLTAGDLAVTDDATIGDDLAVTGDATIGGVLLVSTGGTAINAVNRNAITNFGAYVLRTAGTDRWSLQMINDTTNDLHLSDSAQGTTALLAETRATAPNLSLLTSTKSYGGGVGVLFVPNASTNPSSNPTGGGLLYINAGALTYRGSGGTVTVVAPA